MPGCAAGSAALATGFFASGASRAKRPPFGVSSSRSDGADRRDGVGAPQASRSASNASWTPQARSSARSRSRARTVRGAWPLGRAASVATRSARPAQYALAHVGVESRPAWARPVRATRCVAASRSRASTQPQGSHCRPRESVPGQCFAAPRSRSAAVTASWPSVDAAAADARLSSTVVAYAAAFSFVGAKESRFAGP